MKHIQAIAVALLVAMALVTPSMTIMVNALTGGGTVTNTAPSVIQMVIKTSAPNEGTESTYQTSGGSPTSELNDDGNDYIIVNATVYDANGESDIIYVNFSVDKTVADWEHIGATYYLNHTVSATDRSNASEPAAVENEVHGWDNGTADNGYLSFNFKHTFDHGDDPANGALASSLYTITVTVKDSASSTDTDTASCTVYNYANVTTSGSYWASAGSVNASDTMWGNWSGSSGSTQNSKNYLKEWNNESTGTGNVSISWGGANLENGSNTIPLTNLNVYEGEAASPGAVGSWGAVPANASHTEFWTAITHSEASQTVSWVNYTINIPAATPVGVYQKSFTFTKI